MRLPSLRAGSRSRKSSRGSCDHACAGLLNPRRASGAGTRAGHFTSCAEVHRMVNVSVGSPAGMCTVANGSFYRYVLRLAEAELALSPADQAQLDVLAAVPHATSDEESTSGDGWRIIPATSYEDWPVLEATPQRLRAAFQTARRVLWR